MKQSLERIYRDLLDFYIKAWSKYVKKDGRIKTGLPILARVVCEDI